MSDIENGHGSFASDSADEVPVAEVPVAEVPVAEVPEPDAESVAEPTEGPKPAPEPSSPEVARALEELAGVASLDLAEHPDAYQRIHAELQSALASIDDA